MADRSKSNFPYNILKKLKIPEARNERDKLNSEEFNKVLDFISLNKKDTRWSKFILMMTLQMKTGMRVSELCNIRKRNGMQFFNNMTSLVIMGYIFSTEQE